MDLICLNLNFKPVCLCWSSLSLSVTGLIYQYSAAGPEKLLPPWHKLSASPFTMSHTLHKPTTTQSECQAVVSAAQPLLLEMGSACSLKAYGRPCSQTTAAAPPTWAAPTALDGFCSPSQEALAVLVVCAVPGLLCSPARAWPGPWTQCQGVGHWVLRVPQQEAPVLCCVTLQMRWHPNSSGHSMEGKDCLCPDKKTVSKHKEVWHRMSIKQ